jgi:hypothetical protein
MARIKERGLSIQKKSHLRFDSSTGLIAVKKKPANQPASVV